MFVERNLDSPKNEQSGQKDEHMALLKLITKAIARRALYLVCMHHEFIHN